MHICTVIFTEFVGAHVLMVSPANLDLKVSRFSALVASSGMLFQIRVASGKNECLAERVREYGTRNFSEFPLVLVVSWVKCWSSGMSTRSCRIWYIMTARDLALRSARVSHPRVWSISVTLLSRE